MSTIAAWTLEVRAYFFLSLPRGMMEVSTMARMGSIDTGLAGDVSFFGFLASLFDFC